MPAFGGWNYYYHYDEPELPPAAVAAEWNAPEPEACNDVWFKNSPPPRRPAPKKVSRPGCGIPPENALYDGGKGRQHAGRARASDTGGVLRTPAKGTCRAVRPVDEDLYQVPPPDFVSPRPIRVRTRTEGRETLVIAYSCIYTY